MALDIETRPALVYSWGLWNVNIGVDQIVDPGGMMSFAAKWIGEEEMFFYSDFHCGHKKMVKQAWKLLDQADAVLHYNGKSFDIKHIQREFIEAGLKPTSPFKQIDLLQTARGQFRFLSNKLKHVAPQIGLEQKVEHSGFKLWLRCINKDRLAWEEMKSYNIRDVELLEEAYEELRPWIKNHPSHGAHTGEDVCPKCGSDDLERRGFSLTQTGKFQRFWCKGCGGWSRSNKREAATGLLQVLD